MSALYSGLEQKDTAGQPLAVGGELFQLAGGDGEEGFEEVDIELAELGMGGEEGGVGAVLEDEARGLGVSFPAGLVGQVVEAADALVEALGEVSGEGAPPGSRPGQLGGKLAPTGGAIFRRAGSQPVIEEGAGQAGEVVLVGLAGEAVALGGPAATGRLTLVDDFDEAFGGQGGEAAAEVGGAEGQGAGQIGGRGDLAGFEGFQQALAGGFHGRRASIARLAELRKPRCA